MLLKVAVAAGTLATVACYRVDSSNAPGSTESNCEEEPFDCPGTDSGPVGTAPRGDGGFYGSVDAGPEPCVDDAGNPTCGVSADPPDADVEDATIGMGGFLDAGEGDQ